MIPDYTLICGVDKKHLQQLKLVWPTWKRHKPSLLNHPMLIFFDRFDLQSKKVFEAVDHPNLTCVPWPFQDNPYPCLSNDKFGTSQRYKMLAGFVHIPAIHVNTPYWLKLDVDTVATENDDWIQKEWFKDDPAIIAQPWGFTKPPDQMLKLDEWASECDYLMYNSKPLNLKPEEDKDKVCHKRIISWCGFFDTKFTIQCASIAKTTCGQGMLPVPSQDGFMWYLAKRLKYPIQRISMKSKGWEHWTTMYNIKKAVEKSLRT